MPEAVIVSTARSPIGRAMKGSLVSMRPDDLAAQMVRAALDKVPALNPHQIDDLILGCGLPGGESGVPGSLHYVDLLEPWLTNGTVPLRTTHGGILHGSSSVEWFAPLL